MSSKKDAEFKKLDEELRDSRKAMGAHQGAVNVQPINYPQVGRPIFGAPLALNMNVAAEQKPTTHPLSIQTDNNPIKNNQHATRSWKIFQIQQVLLAVWISKKN